MKLKLSEPSPDSEKPENDEETNNTGVTEVDDKAKQERIIYCKKERKRLQTVSKNKTIHEKDATGKVIKLASKERNQRIAKIKANISKYCK